MHLSFFVICSNYLNGEGEGWLMVINEEIEGEYGGIAAVNPAILQKSNHA
jgi:hypothetical protein